MPLYVTEIAHQIHAVIPDDWLWVQQGRQSGKVATNPMSPEKKGLHSTVLLHVKGTPAELERLEQGVFHAPPTGQLIVKELFVSQAQPGPLPKPYP